jgi:predicted amidohydrolase
MRLRDAAMFHAAQALVRWRGRLNAAQSWLARTPYQQALPPDEDRERVRVAAVQFPAQPLPSPLTYAQACHAWTLRAVEAGAQLIVFPELVGFVPLLGLVPGIEAQATRAASGGDDAGALAVVTRLLAPTSTRIYRFVLQNLSRRFGVHIAAGSAIAAASDGTLRNTAYLFGPDGSEMGHQPKSHFFGMEMNMGLTRGGFIQVFDTPVGKLAMPVCMDYTYPETTRIAYLLGAEMLLNPSADIDADYNWHKQLRGVWGRVQESPCYGVHAMMAGDALGMPFRGQSSIVGPVGLVGNDGILARADGCDGGELVVADLDLAALREFRKDLPVEPRYDWCARQLGAIWESRSL